MKKKTSAEWIRHYPGLKIVEPFGWDLNNFDYSFNKEKITRKEFEIRAAYSSVVDMRNPENSWIAK